VVAGASILILHSFAASALEHTPAELRSLAAAASIEVGCVWLAALGLSALLLRRTSERLRLALLDILETSRLFAEGRLETSLRIEGSPLFEEVAESMNSMAQHLKGKVDILTRQRNEQKAILSGMAEAVIVLNTSLEIIECNFAASELTGLRQEELQGRALIDVIRNTELHTFALETLRASAPREALVTLATAPPRHLEVHCTVLRRDSPGGLGGSTDRLVIVMHDITKIKNLESIRRDFVANVSHELKTPITSIKGFIETLREGAIADPDNAVRFLAIIAKQTQRMEAIVEDLLSLSRLEQSEGRELERSDFSLHEAMESAIEVCSDRAAQRAVTIRLTCDESGTMCGNAILIEQAIVNLVDNAIKYSPIGASVEVDAAVRAASVDITVRDHGIGIPQRELPRIFERFYRVDKARSRELGGTGLGLAIVKHIALAHKGEVLVESSLGFGSVFTLRLPLCLQEKQGAGNAQ